MSQVLSLNNDQFKLECIVIKNDACDELWFKGKEITNMLDYANTAHAISYNVSIDGKK